MNHIKKLSTNYIKLTYNRPVSFFLSGSSLAWATQNGNYHHYPLCLFSPSAYSGYQAFYNKEKISKFYREEFILNIKLKI